MEKEPTYVLLQCDLGFEEEIISTIAKMGNIVEVRGTYGTFDVFCKVLATPRETEETVSRIRRIPRVHSTNTLRSITSQGGK